MHCTQSIAVLCAFAVAACAGLSAPEIIQRFTAQVQPKIEAIQNTPAQDITPKDLQSFASSVSEAAQSADAQLKALKGQPIDVILGVHGSSVADTTKVLDEFIDDAKESTSAVKSSVKGLLASAPTGVHFVARPDVTSLTADIGQVAADLDSLLGDITQLASDTSSL